MPNLERFGQWLRCRRRALDLTRAELAKRANCSVSTLRRLEAGDLRASKLLAESLAAALGLPSNRHEAFVAFARGARHQMMEDDGAGTDASVVRPPSPVSNLPAPLTSFVGRKREVAAVCELMRDADVRLVTLSGPPGTGKTRLGLAAAHALAADFANGAHFVSLASVADADLVASAIAQTLGVRETREGLIPAVRDFLRPRQLLLVLDNFEQVLAAAPLVGDLLASAPGLKALVTSREVLRLYGEHEFPVPTLELPDVYHLPTTLTRAFYTRYASLRLFRDRARAVQPDFRLTADNAAAVARLCAWLDGLPLAIEMAAARVKWMPPHQLLDQLSNRLAALTDGPRDLSPRQQSLIGAIEWSYNLLSPEERRVFNRLGVFAGGCDVEAARAVMGAGEWSEETLRSHLQALVEKSLLKYETAAQGGARYQMLESLREYALDRLRAEGQMERARQRHAEHYAGLAQAARPHLNAGGDQAPWLNRLEAEHNNLRAALAWATASPECPGASASQRAEFALTLAEAMYHFWNIRGYLSEGRRWLAQALALSDAPTELRARTLNSAGRLAQMQGDYAAAQAFQEQALAIQAQLHDEPGRCRSLENLAILVASQGDYRSAGEWLEQSLAVRRRLGDEAAMLPTLNNLAIVYRRLGDLARAEGLYRETADIARRVEAHKALSHALHGLGEVRLLQADHASALAFLRESLALRRQLGNRTDLPTSLGVIAMALYALGDGLTAARLIAASEKLREELGVAIQPSNRAEVEGNIAQVRAQIGATAFARAWAEGQALTSDKAVDLALRTEAPGQAQPA